MLMVGDLVEITMLGSEYYGDRGIVLDRIYIHDEYKHRAHSDEYSCKLNILHKERGVSSYAPIRAKWLKLLSRGIN